MGLFRKERLQSFTIFIQGTMFNDMVAVPKADGGLVNAGLYRSLRFVDLRKQPSKTLFSYRRRCVEHGFVQVHWLVIRLQELEQWHPVDLSRARRCQLRLYRRFDLFPAPGKVLNDPFRFQNAPTVRRRGCVGDVEPWDFLHPGDFADELRGSNAYAARGAQWDDADVRDVLGKAFAHFDRDAGHVGGGVLCPGDRWVGRPSKTSTEVF